MLYFIEMRTIGLKRCASPNEPWIQYWQPKPQARLRLFCFHYAGGGASLFRLYPTHVPAEIEIWPVQLPGREQRRLEQPFSALPALIDALQQALLPYFDGPYAFFGHSMGALVSFELARALRRRGHRPGPLHLGVSGHRAPQIPNHKTPTYNLPEPQFLEALRHLNGTPEEVLRHDELMQLLLPVLRADFAVCETYSYRPEAPLACPISAFGGRNDVDVPTTSLEAWREQTQNTFRCRFFAGDHFFLHKEQQALLTALSQDLQAYL